MSGILGDVFTRMASFQPPEGIGSKVGHFAKKWLIFYSREFVTIGALALVTARHKNAEITLTSRDYAM